MAPMGQALRPVSEVAEDRESQKLSQGDALRTRQFALFSSIAS